MDAKATGRDIILAILENMRESMEPLLYSTVAPSIYDVYLHPDDHERLAGIFPKILEEAKKALNQDLGNVGKPLPFLPVSRKGTPKIEAAEGDWYISFHKDENEELAAGDILVDSRLTLPKQKEFGAGGKTQRTVTLRSDGETRKLKTYREEAREREATALARLAFQDKNGQRQEFLMTAREISIGRGGRTEYCDLELDGPVDISRQHFYLRQDDETREFFIQDVSKFGTTVNGKEIEHKKWVSLPAKAKIGLAGKMVIEFESL